MSTPIDLTAVRHRKQGRPPLPPCEGCGGPSVESSSEDGTFCCQVCINGILAVEIQEARERNPGRGHRTGDTPNEKTP